MFTDFRWQKICSTRKENGMLIMLEGYPKGRLGLKNSGTKAIRFINLRFNGFSGTTHCWPERLLSKIKCVLQSACDASAKYSPYW